jgi:hypothetical protein
MARARPGVRGVGGTAAFFFLLLTEPAREHRIHFLHKRKKKSEIFFFQKKIAVGEGQVCGAHLLRWLSERDSVVCPRETLWQAFFGRGEQLRFEAREHSNFLNGNVARH